MSIDFTKLGIVVAGLCMGKNQYTAGEKERYSLDLAVPGSKQFLSVSVDPEVWEKTQLSSTVQIKCTFSLFKGNVYFQAI